MFCFHLCFTCAWAHGDSPTSRPKATGWAPLILRKVRWATTSAAPTSLISAWHTAARPSQRSFSSSFTLCALWSWTLLMRRTLWPWALSREDAEITITCTCEIPNPVVHSEWMKCDYHVSHYFSGNGKLCISVSPKKKSKNDGDVIFAGVCPKQAWYFTSEYDL